MLFYIVLAALLCKVSSHDPEALETIQEEITLLEKRLQMDLKAGQDDAEDRIERKVAAANAMHIRVLNKLKNYGDDLAVAYDIYMANFEQMKWKNVSSCGRGFLDTLRDIRDREIDRLRGAMALQVKKTKNVMLMFKSAIGSVQNTTFELRKMASMCWYVDHKKCEDSLRRQVLIFKEMLPSIAKTIVLRLQRQLNIYMDRMEYAGDKALNRMAEEHTELLNDFFECVL